MDWATIVPSLLVGAFGGWLYGNVKGHAETQELLNQQERRYHKLLRHLYEGQRDRRREVDLLLGAITKQSKEPQWFWEAWTRTRKEQDERESDDQTGFYAEMHKRP